MSVARLGESRALAETRGHRLTRNVKKVAGEAGFDAATTLLAALGTCLPTNVHAIGEKMRLRSEKARIEFHAARRDEQPALLEIPYLLILKCPQPARRLAELNEVRIQWATVTYTVFSGLTPQGVLVIEPKMTLEVLKGRHHGRPSRALDFHSVR